MILTQGRGGVSPLNALPMMPVKPDPRFEPTGFVVEAMQFLDVEQAVLLSGAGNVVRDNQIGTVLQSRKEQPGQPRASLVAYGPGARVERNIFRQSTRMDGAPNYAIYLRNGDGSVVRQNRIRINGDSGGTVAVGVSVSNNVSLQDNTLERVERPAEFLPPAAAER